MLTPEEKEQIAGLVDQLAGRAGAGEPEAFELLRALPERPEALALARELLTGRQGPLAGALEMAVARLRSLFAADEALRPIGAPGPAATSGAAAAALAKLLDASVPYPAKVDALLAAIRQDDRTVAPVIRERLAEETNPFVLATLASALGHLGEAADGSLLKPLLDSQDARVVANALDAFTRLRAEAPVAQVRELVGAADHRLRLSALGLLARTDGTAVLAMLPGLLAEKQAPLASGIAVLLGNLTGEPRATELLVELIASEERTPVLKHAAQALKRHANRERAEAIVGSLAAVRQSAAGAKAAMLSALWDEIGAQLEMNDAALDELAARHACALAAARPVLAFAPAAALPEPEAPPPAPAAPPAGHTTPPEGFRAIEGDEPLSFSTLAMQRPSAAQLEKAKSGSMNRPALKGSGPVAAPPARSGGFTAPAGLLPAAPDDAAAGARVPPWAWVAGSLAAAACAAFAFSPGGSPPRSAASAGLSRSAQLAGDRGAAPALPADPPRTRAAHGGGSGTAAAGAPGEGPFGRPAAKHLGPTGGEVRIEGIVVTTGLRRVVVKCRDRFYSLRGKGLEDLKVGDPIKRTGRLSGMAADGMIFLTVSG